MKSRTQDRACSHDRLLISPPPASPQTLPVPPHHPPSSRAIPRPRTQQSTRTCQGSGPGAAPLGSSRTPTRLRPSQRITQTHLRWPRAERQSPAVGRREATFRTRLPRALSSAQSFLPSSVTRRRVGPSDTLTSAPARGGPTVTEVSGTPCGGHEGPPGWVQTLPRRPSAQRPSLEARSPPMQLPPPRWPLAALSPGGGGWMHRGPGASGTGSPGGVAARTRVGAVTLRP